MTMAPKNTVQKMCLNIGASRNTNPHVKIGSLFSSCEKKKIITTPRECIALATKAHRTPPYCLQEYL